MKRSYDGALCFRTTSFVKISLKVIFINTKFYQRNIKMSYTIGHLNIIRYSKAVSV